MRSAIVFALAAAAGVSSQEVPTYNSTLDMEIDPASVQPPARLAEMCTAQWNSCRLLCDNDTEENECEDSDLSYSCTCRSNSSAPGLQYYSQTMPTLICQELFSQCNTQYVGNARAQSACEENIFSKCDDLPAPPAASTDDDEDDESSSTSTAASQTSAPTEAPNDDGENEDSVTTTSSDGFAAPTLAPAGNGVAAIAAIGVLAYLI